MKRDGRSDRAGTLRRPPWRLPILSAVFCAGALVAPLVGRAAGPGDCDDDGRVTVAELVTAVNIALGTRPLADCAAADASGDGQVSITDLVIDVATALGIERATPGTSTPTSTPTATATTTGSATAVAGSFIGDQRIVYSDGLHNENTEMIRLGDRILLDLSRRRRAGQSARRAAHINVFESLTDGRTFTRISQVNANNLPGGRDIRDPKLVEMDGTLFLYAISRVPGRPLPRPGRTGVDASAPSRPTAATPGPHRCKTYAGRRRDAATETFWGFWRYTKRTVHRSPESTGGPCSPPATRTATPRSRLFASDDGVTWEKRATIIASYDDVPSEAELQFFGDNHETAVALVRLDNQDILANGQTAICTSNDPFITWECGRRIDQRLDGPTWIVRPAGGRARSFVFARKHLPCTFKRTAVYELRGDLADPGAAHRGLRDSGARELGRHGLYLARTAQPGSVSAGLVQQRRRSGAAVVAGHLLAERHLARRRRLSASRRPAACHRRRTRPCEPPPLPPSTAAFDVTGAHLLTLAPVIWPSQPVFFRADARVHGTIWT